MTKIGFDDPTQREQVLRALLEEELKELLKEQGFRPSGEDAEVWIRDREDMEGQ